jgi:hypothetical protein
MSYLSTVIRKKVLGNIVKSASVVELLRIQRIGMPRGWQSVVTR